jgi:competence protein ComEA
MDAAPPTKPVCPQPGLSLPPVSAVWPRSAQLTTAFLLGLATALLIIHLWSMSRWSTRPLILDQNHAAKYRVDLNQADHAQLLQVSGIGDRTADKIEAYRQEHGDFRSPEEVTRVRGIGPATYQKMSDWVTVRPGTSKAGDDAIVSRQAAKSSPMDIKSKKPSKKEENLKGPIDINQADGKELQQLPGIGPKLAQRILDERAKAPFQSVEDLRRVSGIGPKILERLRPYVKVRQKSDRIAVGSTN